MLIDSHAHLDLPQFNKDREKVIQRGFSEGLSAIVTIGISLTSSRRAIEIAEDHQHIHAVIGVHPHDAKMVTRKTLDEVRNLSRHEKVVGLGETGLDFYRNLSPRDRQIAAFHDFLDLSGELALPIVIHDRDASREVYEILKDREGSYVPGIIHCFSGDWEHARKCMALGFFISISGVVTFPKAKDLHDVVKKLPADRILVETDCPFLTPDPHRGKRNEPAFVQYTAMACARLRGEEYEVLAGEALKNTCSVFKISF
jgi:TatD DNase family protein